MLRRRFARTARLHVLQIVGAIFRRQRHRIVVVIAIILGGSVLLLICFTVYGIGQCRRWLAIGAMLWAGSEVVYRSVVAVMFGLRFTGAVASAVVAVQMLLLLRQHKVHMIAAGAAVIVIFRPIHRRRILIPLLAQCFLVLAIRLHIVELQLELLVGALAVRRAVAAVRRRRRLVVLERHVRMGRLLGAIGIGADVALQQHRRQSGRRRSRRRIAGIQSVLMRR